MGLSNGYVTALKRNGEFVEDFDAKVRQWKNDIEEDYAGIIHLQKTANISFQEASNLRRLTQPAPTLFKVY